MDWTARARAAFEPENCPDDTVLEELGQHAADVCHTALVGGRDAADAEREALALLARFASDPAAMRRQVLPTPAVEPPPVAASFGAGCLQDLRYAWRRACANRAHSLVVVLTMALGIAASTVLFSIVYGVLLRPLPWPDANRLVRLYETRIGSGRPFQFFTNATYLEWRQRPKTLEQIAAYTSYSAAMTGPGEPEEITIVSATPALFPVLRARPALGSLFSVAQTDDGEPADTRELILGHGLWQRRFGGRTDVVGNVVKLNGDEYHVVGVMPEGFAFPSRDASAWIPFQVPAVSRLNGPGRLKTLDAIARLKADLTPQQASEEGAARGQEAPDHRLAARALFGSTGRVQVKAVPLVEALTSTVRPALVVLLVAVGLLLVAATTNVANIQLAAAISRRREMAIRAALGASSRRLAQQLLVENMLLGIAGGAIGLLLAGWLLHAIPALLPADFPRVHDIAFDWRVAMFASALSLVTGVVFGLVPAIAVRRTNLVGSLTEDGLAPAGWGARTRTIRARLLIMSGQVAIACVLLLAAALLTRSFVALLAADRGYDRRNVLTALLPLPGTAFRPQQRMEILDATVARMSTVPAVVAAAYSTRLPLTSGENMAAFPVADPRGTAGTITARAYVQVVSPAYFKAMRLRVVEGRVFSGTDVPTSPRVTVVNREFARQFLGAQTVGTHLPSQQGEVVGIVENVNYGDPGESAQPEVYDCTCQIGVASYDSFAIVVRAADDASRLIAALRGVVKEQAPTTVLESPVTMDERIWTSLARQRLYAMLLTAFALFTMIIAGVGLFSVLHYSVAQRSREIGVRTALGARPSSIVALVVRQAFGVALVGLTAGLLVFSVLAKYIATLLFGVAPFDALSFGVVPLVLLAVTLLACAVPAKRAAQVDSNSVLH